MWSAGLSGWASEFRTQDSLHTLVSRFMTIVFRNPDLSKGFATIILHHPYDGVYVFQSSKDEV